MSATNSRDSQTSMPSLPNPEDGKAGRRHALPPALLRSLSVAQPLAPLPLKSKRATLTAINEVQLPPAPTGLPSASNPSKLHAQQSAQPQQQPAVPFKVASNDARELMRLKYESERNVSSAKRALLEAQKQVFVLQQESQMAAKLCDQLIASQAELTKSRLRVDIGIDEATKFTKKALEEKISSFKDSFRANERTRLAVTEQFERTEYHMRRNDGEIFETIELLSTYDEKIHKCALALQQSSSISTQLKDRLSRMFLSSLSYVLNAMAISWAVVAKVQRTLSRIGVFGKLVVCVAVLALLWVWLGPV
eukprot:m.383929 g.383929  ORF g.383929 m.383929 type:complete len:307 (-) comp56260_c0_seq1:2785-3705(-)